MNPSIQNATNPEFCRFFAGETTTELEEELLKRLEGAGDAELERDTATEQLSALLDKAIYDLNTLEGSIDQVYENFINMTPNEVEGVDRELSDLAKTAQSFREDNEESRDKCEHYFD